MTRIPCVAAWCQEEGFDLKPKHQPSHKHLIHYGAPWRMSRKDEDHFPHVKTLNSCVFCYASLPSRDIRQLCIRLCFTFVYNFPHVKILDSCELYHASLLSKDIVQLCILLYFTAVNNFLHVKTLDTYLICIASLPSLILHICQFLALFFQSTVALKGVIVSCFCVRLHCWIFWPA